ncbi:MAG: PAS domain S-box protein, partial [Bacteroidales bacterium]|nr:PAS domain S-box protein [Bacteroidales bacterium]
MVSDITERHHTEKAINESMENMRAIIDQSVDMIMLHDFKGQVLAANLKAIRHYGYTRKELIKMNIAEIDTYSEKNLYHEKFWQQLDSNQPFMFETFQKTKNGGSFPVEASFTKISVNNRPLDFIVFQGHYPA